jgi:hypothetical protein
LGRSNLAESIVAIEVAWFRYRHGHDDVVDPGKFEATGALRDGLMPLGIDKPVG